jgi:phospholipase C
MRFQILPKLLVVLLVAPLGKRSTLLPAQESPSHSDAVNAYYIQPDREATIPQSKLVELLREKVKYVFVLYQENRSFDSYFGTFPGGEGLFSRPANQTPGFVQTLVNTDGSQTTIHPFRIGPKDLCALSTINSAATTLCYAADTDDIDHSHPRIVAKMDVLSDVPRMDKFAVTEELKYSPTGNPTLKAKQFGELAMAYEDCDTVPLLWTYADKFVLFDHIFQTLTGPSTPGNLAIIGAQNGETQWALHPDQAYADNGSSLSGVPVLNDDDPLWGSPSDSTPAAEKMPVNPGDYPGYGTQINLTYATLPLTLAGSNLKNMVKADADPDDDLADVQHDVAFISGLRKSTVPFGWFEEGYDKEPTDPNDPVDANGTHASYITHHNGPQYFGYISNNSQMRQQLHGLGDFFTALQGNTLPTQGGVFFVKGGYQNLFGLKPVDPDSKVKGNFLGDDDHPAYSDAQISEAMVAEAINRIAASPYWRQSAIIVTWDDSEGDYDHVPPPIRTYGPDQSIVTNGPRVPFLLISPYARTHYIAHSQGSQSSVVKFVDTLFDLTPLALLPDELSARQIGEEEFGQKGLGPEDALTPGITDLLDAFSPSRLMGNKGALPASYVTVPETLIRNLPQTTGYGCKDLGITTTDRRKGITNIVPGDFNPRPSTNPTP